MNSVEKGRIAEAKAVASLVAQGWEVYLPIYGNGICDIIASKDNRLVRIEAKYVGTENEYGTFEVALRQVRPNGMIMTIKKFNANNADVLAVYVAPRDVVIFLPTEKLNGRSTIRINSAHLEGCRSLV